MMVSPEARIKKQITKATVPKFGQTPKNRKSKTNMLSKQSSEVATRQIAEVTGG